MKRTKSTAAAVIVAVSALTLAACGGGSLSLIHI